MKRPTLPPPAMTTRITDPPCGGLGAAVPSGPDRRTSSGWKRRRTPRPLVRSTRTAGRPPGRPCSGRARARRARRPIAATRDPVDCSKSVIGLPIHGFTTWRSMMHTWAVGSVHSAPVGSGSSRRMTWSVVHATVATVARAEALVDRGPARVVDAGDHPVDPERLPRDPGDQDVGVVAARHRGDRSRPLDAGLDEAVAVEADALQRLAGEVLGQPLEGRAAPIDDGDRVALSGAAATAPSPPDRTRPR